MSEDKPVTVKTSKGNLVTARAPEPDLNDVDVELARRVAKLLVPDAKEVSGPTRRYNCHGHAFTGRKGWFDYPDLFISDDHHGVAFEEARVGDVAIYMNEALVTHSALVERAEGGKIIRLRSKWGEVAEFYHTLDQVPDDYGKAAVLLRRTSGLPPASGGGASYKDAAAHQTEEPAVTDVATTPDAASKTTPAGGVTLYSKLMLASTPAVRKRIIESQAIPGRGVGKAGAGAPNDDKTSGEPSGGQEGDVNELLAKLYEDGVRFKLMLGSSDEVKKAIIENLPEVKNLKQLGKKAGRAALELFEKEGTQKDDQLTGILLHLLQLEQVGVGEAVGPLIVYLSRKKGSRLNRELAAQAFLTSLSA